MKRPPLTNRELLEGLQKILQQMRQKRTPGGRILYHARIRIREQATEIERLKLELANLVDPKPDTPETVARKAEATARGMAIAQMMLKGDHR